MSARSVLTGEALDGGRRSAEQGHTKAAVAVAGAAHAVALLVLMGGLGRVPSVPEGPVGFEPLTLVFEVRAGPGGGGGGGGEASPEPPPPFAKPKAARASPRPSRFPRRASP